MPRRVRNFFLIAAAIRFALIFITDITPQEAYYWNFSRHLAIGYFDHPPVTAWTIWFFTKIFGTNILGIRFGAYLYGLGALWFLWLIAKKLWDEKVAFYVLLAAFVVPLFTTSGLIFTPDPPLVFFWLAFIYTFILALENGRLTFWILSGILCGLAMLSKYTAAFLCLGAFILMITRKEWRKYFATPKPYIAIILSIIAFSPEIIWNMNHGWASFLYQSARRAHELRHLDLGYFFGYLGAQLFAVSPIFYYGVWQESISSIPGKSLIKRIILAFTVPMLFFFTAVALFYWVKLNWLIPAYFIPVAAFVANSVIEGKKLHITGTIIAGTITFIVFLAMILPFIPLSGELASTFGWEELAQRVEHDMLGMPEETFIFGAEYKVPSELAYHLSGRPETVGGHVIGKPGLQYEFWCDPETLIGKNAIFVLDPRWGVSRSDAEKLIKKYFERVQRMEPLRVYRGKTRVTVFQIYRCFNYKGPEKE